MVHRPPAADKVSFSTRLITTHAVFLYRASGGGINQAVQAIAKRHPSGHRSTAALLNNHSYGLFCLTLLPLDECGTHRRESRALTSD
jgi:hypothetical protein